MLATRLAKSVLIVCLLSTSVCAKDTKPEVDADGTVTSPAARFPFSVYASPQALQRFRQIFDEARAAPPLGGPIEASRKFYGDINDARAERMQKLYPVEIKASKIGGVGVDVITPAGNAVDKKRVLINLHGGAFLWGAGSGGLVEAIPVASLSRIKVISVDYRQGPEYTFPAASEDVENVYRALLRHHRAQDIGIYGCSAGGVLTAEAIAWIASQSLPTPGAIGIFCAGVVDMGGDSAYISPLLMGDPVPVDPLQLGMLPYFKGADMKDPLVMPGSSPAALAKFPPTLLISGTRDFALSALLRSNELLSEAGVATELHVWEGMWHSFFSDPELPESKAAYAVMARFFERELGRPAHGPNRKPRP
ncbi:MAG TPA: alpha/beta hydrolase [Rudaea sp.]|jgi:acetyl esterase/lipase|uniref:alpha/beta hydrolase n=1 Tax=Rudaea sp. TaxID=2136325 RepID=UPI002F929D1B